MTLQRIQPQCAAHLIAELDDYLNMLYPAESNHLATITALSQPNVKMMGYYQDGVLCAIGAVKVTADYGEIKRVYVQPAHRGQGLARQIMYALEAILLKKNRQFAYLETGIYQPAAIALYQRLGYVECQPFGDYQPDPLSVFMVKPLGQ